MGDEGGPVGLGVEGTGQWVGSSCGVREGQRRRRGEDGDTALRLY